MKYPTDVKLEDLFWYLVLQRYLERDDPDFEELVDVIRECEVSSNDHLGFKPSLVSKATIPDVWSTFYALSCLELLGKLNYYLNMAIEERRRERLVQFLKDLQYRDYFLHCPAKCDACHDRELAFQTYFFAIQTLDKLNYNLLEILPAIAPFLDRKIKRAERNKVFRMLAAVLLKRGGHIEESEIQDLMEFQRGDGGFSYQPEGSGDVADTFWTVLALDANRWIVDFPKGPLATFAIDVLNAIDPDGDATDPSTLARYARAVVLLAQLWAPLVDDLELVVFNHLQERTVMDLDTLTEQGQIQSIEARVLESINQRYQFQLEIVDAEAQFRQIVRDIDVKSAKLAKLVREALQDAHEVDLNKLVVKFNLGKLRRNWTSVEEVKEAISQLIHHHLLRGTFTKKRRFFRSTHYFIKNKLIQRVVSSDRVISLKTIQEERDKLLGYRSDIENFTREMKQSHKNIMKEVESLILIEEVEWAKRRLTSSIKNALFDAEFFNKNVEKFIDAFTYLDPQYSLQDQISAWRRTYQQLRDNFENIETILSAKIEEVERRQREREAIMDLQDSAKGGVKILRQRLEDLKRVLNDVNKENPQQLKALLTFQKEVRAFQDLVDLKDTEFKREAQAISNHLAGTRKKRKEIVEYWVAEKDKLDPQVEELDQLLAFWSEWRGSIRRKQEAIARDLKAIQSEIKPLLDEKQLDQAKDRFHQTIASVVDTLAAYREDLGKALRKAKKKIKHFTFRPIQASLNYLSNETHSFIEENIARLTEKFETRLTHQREVVAQETCQALVAGAIQTLEDKLSAFQDFMKDRLGDVKGSKALKMVGREIEKFHETIVEESDKLEDQLQDQRAHVPNVDALTRVTTAKWQTFKNNFNDQLTSVQREAKREIIKSNLFARLENHRIQLDTLASDFKLDEEEIRTEIQEMLNEGLINGELRAAGEVVVFTDAYQNLCKFQDILDAKESQITRSFSHITHLYENSIKLGRLLMNAGELESRIIDFRELVREADPESLEREAVALRVVKADRERVLAQFSHRIRAYRENLDLIVTTIRTLDDLDQFIREKVDLLRKMVDSTVKIILTRIREAEEPSKKLSVSTASELKILEKNIESVERDVLDRAKSYFKDFPNGDRVIVESKEFFFAEKRKILERYKKSKELVKQELEKQGYQEKYHEFAQFLEQKTDKLVVLLGRIQAYVNRKITTHEFKTASSNLHQKVKEFNDLFDRIQSKIKKMNRSYRRKYKGISLKLKGLLDRWDLWVTELNQTIREKVVRLEADILANYLKFSIVAFKDEFVPLGFLAEELKMRKGEIKERIIGLIGEGRLPGKYYPELDIYYENPSALEQLDAEALEMIKLGSYKVHMFVSRIKILAKQNRELIAFIASIFTILSALYAFLGPWVLYLSPGIVLFAILIGVKKIKQKQKKLADSIEDDSNLPTE